MALANSGDGGLRDFLGLSQAATHNLNDQEILCDNLFETLTNNITNCEYYDTNCKLIQKNSLLLLHINVRSLSKNFDLLHEFLTSLNSIPQVICISESRIKNHPLVNIDLPNYSFLHVDSDTNAGGVAMYVHNSINFTLAQKQYKLNNSESLWIDFREPSGNLYTVGVIYRHPCTATADYFIDDLCACLSDLINRKSTFYVLGDININISDVDRPPIANRYINMLFSCGALPLITKPTRVTESSATIIDHVITNDSKHNLKPGIFQTNEVSDHFIIFCQINKALQAKKPKKKVEYYRDKSKFDADMFCYDLNEALRSFFSHLPALSDDNFNGVFQKFTSLILQIIDKHAPLKKYSRRQKN